MAVADNYIGAGMCAMICQDISLPKLAKKEKRPLTAVERDAIGKADFTDRERAFVYLIYSCGLRRGEALALSIFDFHLGDGQATVSITKSLIFDGNAPEIKDMPKTENGFRTLPIPGSTAGFLKGYIAGLPSSFLFTCRGGGLVTHSSYVKMWASIRRKMNHAAGGTDAFPAITGLTAHTFRHNYCTNLCYKVPEISIKKIAQLMGDSERMVMDVYNHIMEEREDPAAVINSILAI
jgi:integrase